jgi:two-component system cell cycle response regulator DivK
MGEDQPSVLYVEDNVDNLILVKRVLEAEGFHFIGAGSAEEGLFMARSSSPDLILVDINMPEIDGLTMTSHLKMDPSFSAVPVIALTANVMRGDRERSLNAGCDGYIQKPIDVDQLSNQLARFLQP